MHICKIANSCLMWSHKISRMKYALGRTLLYRIWECPDLENLKWSVGNMKASGPFRSCKKCSEVYLVTFPKCAFNRRL